MSLPTYATFYDDKGQEIGKEFINVGWFFTPNALKGEVNRLINDGYDLFNICEYFIVYGYKIKRKDISYPTRWEKV